MGQNHRFENGDRGVKLVEHHTTGGEEFVLRNERSTFLCVNRSEAVRIHAQLGALLYPAPVRSPEPERVVDLTYAEGGVNGSSDGFEGTSEPGRIAHHPV